MHRTILITLALFFTICSLACGLASGDQTFTVSGWKSASKDQRRRMARDFLKKYNTKGMTLAQIKDLLGDPDYEQDSWSYNLSIKGAPPPGPQTMQVFREHPKLYVLFKEGKVDSLSMTEGVQPDQELSFDPESWKASTAQERLKMAANLIESGVLKGRNKEEAQQILGPPDDQSEKREVEYDLGIRMIDVVTLTFTINDDGVVSDSQVIEH